MSMRARRPDSVRQRRPMGGVRVTYTVNTGYLTTFTPSDAGQRAVLYGRETTIPSRPGYNYPNRVSAIALRDGILALPEHERTYDRVSQLNGDVMHRFFQEPDYRYKHDLEGGRVR